MYKSTLYVVIMLQNQLMIQEIPFQRNGGRKVG